MKPVRVLDPSHVLAVCTYAAQVPGEQAPSPEITLTATADAVTIRTAGDEARIATMVRALHQAGYDAVADGDLITVRGWSRARLSRRIAQLDAALQWLTEQLPFTPRTSVALYRKAVADHARSGRDARNHARQEVVRNLRDLVQRRTGPLTERDQVPQPGDPRTGMLLRQCRWLEDEVDLLLSRHRTIATQAIAEHRVEADRADEATHVAAHDAPTAHRDPPDPHPTDSAPGPDRPRPTSPVRRSA